MYMHTQSQTHTDTCRNMYSIHGAIQTHACWTWTHSHSLAGFHSPHQTKRCNLSPSRSQCDLRPLKVSRSVCGGQKCQSCGFQRQAERLPCGDWLLYMLWFYPWGAVFSGCMCERWRLLGSDDPSWAQLKYSAQKKKKEKKKKKLSHLWALL